MIDARYLDMIRSRYMYVYMYINSPMSKYGVSNDTMFARTNAIPCLSSHNTKGSRSCMVELKVVST